MEYYMGHYTGEYYMGHYTGEYSMGDAVFHTIAGRLVPPRLAQAGFPGVCCEVRVCRRSGLGSVDATGSL